MSSLTLASQSPFLATRDRPRGCQPPLDPRVGGTQVVVPHHPWLHPSLTHSTSAHLVPLACKGNEANGHVCTARGRVGRTFTVSHLALLALLALPATLGSR